MRNFVERSHREPADHFETAEHIRYDTANAQPRARGKLMKNPIWTKLLVIAILLTPALACKFDFGSNATSNANSPDSANTTGTANAAAPAGDPLAAGGESQPAAASALVADLYKQHDSKRSPFFQTQDRGRVDKFFAKPLSDLIWNDARNAGGGVGTIDADPLYNAQDVEIKNLKVGEAQISGDRATVPVTFNNYTQKVTITYALKTVAGTWKIDDIRYSENDTLLKWLRSGLSDTTSSSPTGEFEGKYQVGDTTCTVTPFKMAFEVKWAKGSGVETFFFKEGNTFEAEAKGGANRFEFDDENYNTGTFYRADGKTFPVRRAS